MLKNDRFFILADGNEYFLSKDSLLKLSAGKIFIALDGACRHLRDLGIVPDVVLGDMDSADDALLSFFAKKGSKIVHTPDQNFSDLEKGIFFCHERGARAITIFNPSSGRMDHFVGNIFFLKKYYNSRCPIRMFTDSSCILFLRDEKVKLDVKIGAKCGFFGLPNCKVSSDGVKFQLNAMPLTLGMSESIANEFISEHAQVEVDGDCLLIYEI